MIVADCGIAVHSERRHAQWKVFGLDGRLPDSRSLAWARLKDSRTSMQDAAVVALIAASFVSARRSRSLCKWGVPQTRYAADARAKARAKASGHRLHSCVCVVRRKAAVLNGGGYSHQAAPFEANHGSQLS